MLQNLEQKNLFCNKRGLFQELDNLESARIEAAIKAAASQGLDPGKPGDEV